MRRLICLISIFIFFPMIGSSASAESGNQFITIVNPVRISSYNSNPPASLIAQYSIINNFHLPATWLFTYDALVHPGLMNVAKQMNPRQEMGIFFEVSPDFAKSAGVGYHQTASWHFANSVFLSGYTQDERIKLIDTVFSKFYSIFGSYPVSIGSWWTDAFSLQYLNRKYGVVANLGVSDQFKTDGYQVWGQFWSTPFYPSVSHPAVPASSAKSKLDLVTFQWAPRDPYWGYQNSLYSTQDYTQVGKDTAYFKYLVELYAGSHLNQFGQVTVGLESDLSPASYMKEFASQMGVVNSLVGTGQYTAATMSDFSLWYRSRFPDLSPPQTIVSGSSVWYQSPRYRIGFVHDSSNKTTKINDFRSYSDSLTDPYYLVPNGNRDLFITIPSGIDSVGKPGSEKTLSLGEFVSLAESDSALTLRFTQGVYSLAASPPPQDLVFRDLSPQIPYAIRSRLGHISNPLSVVIIVVALSLVFRLIKRARLLILISILVYLVYSSQNQYLVSQHEVDALNYLAVLPAGSIMVYDRDCLRCHWYTPYRPAAMANKRNYVYQIGRHPVIYSNSFLTAADGGQGKLILKKNSIKYLYLVKYADFLETPLFSPSDLNITKIYENANAQIWKFNESSD